MVHSVTVVTPATATDRYGNTVRDWANATRTTYSGWVEKRGRTEQTASGDRNLQLADWLLMLPATAVITGSARVEYDGATFDVIGPPQLVRTPRGPHHIEADLRSREG